MRTYIEYPEIPPRLAKAIKVTRTEIYNVGDVVHIIEKLKIVKVRILSIRFYYSGCDCCNCQMRNIFFDGAAYQISKIELYTPIGTPLDNIKWESDCCTYKEHKRANYALGSMIYLQKLREEENGRFKKTLQVRE